jgi:hypothetical protein
LRSFRQTWPAIKAAAICPEGYVMERTSPRFAIVMIIFVFLFPAVSTARGPLVPGAEHLDHPAAFHGQEEEGGIARLLALLREVFGDWAGGGSCEDSPCEKEEENRVGIDPNGNR